MNTYQRRQLLVGAGGLVIAGAALAAEPRRDVADFSKARLNELIPERVEAWTGSVDPDVVPESVDASVDHGQTLSLRYVSPTLDPVMLVVSYHGPQSPDLKVHRPETCYTVAGFEGARPTPVGVPVSMGRQVPSVAFTARRAERIETVLYWTRVGDRFPQTLTEQRTAFLREAVEGVRADGLLMRASTIGAAPGESLKTLRTFAAALVRSATPRGRSLLLGPEGARAV